MKYTVTAAPAGKLCRISSSLRALCSATGKEEGRLQRQGSAKAAAEEKQRKKATLESVWSDDSPHRCPCEHLCAHRGTQVQLMCSTNEMTFLEAASGPGGPHRRLGKVGTRRF